MEESVLRAVAIPDWDPSVSTAASPGAGLTRRLLPLRVRSRPRRLNPNNRLCRHRRDGVVVAPDVS